MSSPEAECKATSSFLADGHRSVPTATIQSDDSSSAYGVCCDESREPKTIPLGSIIELSLRGICQLSIPASEALIVLINDTLSEKRDLFVQGRLMPLGATSMCSLLASSLSIDENHCSDHLCVRFRGHDGIILRFECTPDMLQAMHPEYDILRLYVEIRPKRSRVWCFALCINFEAALRAVAGNSEWIAGFQLLDQDDNPSGILDTRIRCGILSNLEEERTIWQTIQHQPEERVVTVEIQGLKARTQLLTRDQTSLYAELWPCSLGKRAASRLSTLQWNMDASLVKATIRAQWIIVDVTTEVFNLQLYRFSSMERNQLVGSCSFGIPVTMYTKEGDAKSCSQWMYLWETPPKHLKSADYVRISNTEWIGQIFVSMGMESTNNSRSADKYQTLASTVLKENVYSVTSIGTCCQLELQLAEVRCEDDWFYEGDSIAVRLQIPSHNWRVDVDGILLSNKVLNWNKIYNQVVQWAPNSREVPILEVQLRATRKDSTRKKPAILPNSSSTVTKGLTKQRKKQVSISSADEGTIEISGSYHLSLCGLFAQPTAWMSTLMLIPLNLTKQEDSAHASEEITSRFVPVYLNVRLKPSSVFSSIQSDTEPSIRTPLYGDICIHLLHANGSFLRKVNQDSEIYVSVSCGTQDMSSRACCVKSDRIEWNDHVVLRVKSAASPIIKLLLFKKEGSMNSIAAGNAKHAVSHQDENIGWLTLALSPTVTQQKHLVTFLLPIMSPDKNQQSAFRKVGNLAFEVQFIEQVGSIGIMTRQNELIELVIHQLRGHQSCNGVIPTLLKHIFLQVAFSLDNNKTEHDIGDKSAIVLRPDGCCGIEETFELPNDLILAATTSNSVLIVKLCGMSGEVYGRAHLPLRKSWTERLHRMQRVWLSVHSDKQQAKFVDTAMLVSLQTRKYDTAPDQIPHILGKLYVEVQEAILVAADFYERKDMTASIELSWRNKKGNMTKRRTKRQISNNNQWTWKEGVFVVDHSSTVPLDKLYFGLALDDLPLCPLLGEVNVLQQIATSSFSTWEYWVSLAATTNPSEVSKADRPAIGAQLHLQFSYKQATSGTIGMCFGHVQPFRNHAAFTESQIEKCFLKCSVQGKSYLTTMSDADFGCARQIELDAEWNLLQIPYNSMDVSAQHQLPSIRVQWIGRGDIVGEICLGECMLDIISCLQTAQEKNVDYGYTKWCILHDPNDVTRRTGLVKIRITFHPTEHNRTTLSQRTTLPITPSSTQNPMVISAELFAVWKKFFYLLDQNRNGKIDIGEFQDIFLNHLEVLSETSDGQKLLQVLFDQALESDGIGNNNAQTVPSSRQVQRLFAEIDRNSDNEVEWEEYLAFLYRKQQAYFPVEEFPGETGQGRCLHNLDSSVPCSQNRRELSKKYCKDPTSMCNSVSTSATSTRRVLSQVYSSSSVEEGLLQKSGPDTTRHIDRKSKFINDQDGNLDQLVILQDRLHASEEQLQMRTQVSALHTELNLERLKYSKLYEQWQTLQRSHQQLLLKIQKEAILLDTKAIRVKRTLEQQEQILLEREAARRHQHVASIVLQSRIRSRFEQKRFQGLKQQRINAAITLQCFARSIVAKKQLNIRQDADRTEKKRFRAATTLQKFVHYHLRRKERVMMHCARKISVETIQKYWRRRLAIRTWKVQKTAVLIIQCWIRQRLAIQCFLRLLGAFAIIRRKVLGWALRLRWRKQRCSIVKLQRWWKATIPKRWHYYERLEAAICIQASWRAMCARVNLSRYQGEQGRHAEQIEAVICIQAMWRGRQERLNHHQMMIQREQICPMRQQLDLVSMLQSRWRFIRWRRQGQSKNNPADFKGDGSQKLVDGESNVADNKSTPPDAQLYSLEGVAGNVEGEDIEVGKPIHSYFDKSVMKHGQSMLESPTFVENPSPTSNLTSQQGEGGTERHRGNDNVIKGAVLAIDKLAEDEALISAKGDDNLSTINDNGTDAMNCDMEIVQCLDDIVQCILNDESIHITQENNTMPMTALCIPTSTINEDETKLLTNMAVEEVDNKTPDIITDDIGDKCGELIADTITFHPQLVEITQTTAALEQRSEENTIHVTTINSERMPHDAEHAHEMCSADDNVAVDNTVFDVVTRIINSITSETQANLVD